MKSKANVNENLDPSVVRFLEFIQENGGYVEVAGRMGTHPQVFYNVKNGKSKPSWDTFLTLKNIFGDKMDLDFIATGVRSNSISADESYVEAQTKAIEARVRAEVEKTLLEKDLMIEDYRRDKDLMRSVIADLKKDDPYSQLPTHVLLALATVGKS